MRCQFCNSGRLKVIDKRTSPGDKIRRRRECLNCSKRFTTYEQFAELNLKIIKKDGKKELFDSLKLLNSLKNACKNRPIEDIKFDNLIEGIKKEIRSNDTPEIQSSIIGKVVLNKLKKIDKVAYLRFASIHENFEGLESFEEKIGKLKDGNRKNK